LVFAINDKNNASHLLKITNDEFENRFNLNFDSLEVFFTDEKESLNKSNNQETSTYNKFSEET